MELSDNKSILLNIGDLKVSDTEKTFNIDTIINGFEYMPLFDCNLDIGLNGFYTFGSHIRKENKNLIFAYSSNRISNKAMEMAIGYIKNGEYCFLKEVFMDIYTKPFCISRSLVIVDDIINSHKIKEIKLLHYGQKMKISKKELEQFKEWLENMKFFEDAFSKENLDTLSQRIQPLSKRI